MINKGCCFLTAFVFYFLKTLMLLMKNSFFLLLIFLAFLGVSNHSSVINVNHLKKELILKYKDKAGSTICFQRTSKEEGGLNSIDSILIHYSDEKDTDINYALLYNKSVFIQRDDSFFIHYNSGQELKNKYSKYNKRWFNLTNMGNPYYNSKRYFNELSDSKVVQFCEDSMTIVFEYNRKLKNHTKSICYTVSLKDTSIIKYKISQKSFNNMGSWQYEYKYYKSNRDIWNIIDSINNKSKNADIENLTDSQKYQISFVENDTFPDIPFINLQGDTTKIKTEKPFILLDFWYIGCAPCKEAIPELNKIMVNFPNIQVYGVNSFQKKLDEIHKYASKSNIQYEILLNTSLKCNFPHPTFVLLDSNLLIHKVYVGYNRTNMESIKIYLKSISK
jgi:thiol-disulfide isomerase/thioredoxin